jgi:hypothetical protein
MSAWAYIAHQDGYWFGLASAAMPRKDLVKSLGRWALDGATVITVHSREEYLATMQTLKPWEDRPDAA